MPKKSPPLPVFSQRLTQAREHAGLTLYALAVRSGLNHQTVTNLERGAAPSLETACALADGLGLPLAWLAGRDDEVPEKSQIPS